MCSQDPATYANYIDSKVIQSGKDGHARESAIKTKSKIDHPGLRNGSMLNVGVSTFELSGTPSALRRSKKMWHSPTRIAHSASARPAYVPGPAAAPSGLRGIMSCGTVPNDSKKSCAAVGSLGGNNFRSLLGRFAFSNHSR